MSYRLFEEKRTTDEECSDKLQKAKDSFIKDYKYIQSLGFVRTYEHHDGGVGRTFENLIGVDENNLSIADYKGFIELKSQRSYTGSMISLFSKSPSYPKNTNSILRERYGHTNQRLGQKVLNTTISHSKFNSYFNEWGFKLNINDELKRLELKIKNLKGQKTLTSAGLLKYFIKEEIQRLEKSEKQEIEDFLVYWNFEELQKKVEGKCSLIAYIEADTRKRNDKEEYHFKKATLLSGLDFINFLESIRQDSIVLDIRLGVYRSGKNKGRTHDHGSAFRVKKNKIKEIFNVEIL